MKTNTILDILLFPLGVFIEAFVGILMPVKTRATRRRRRWALLFLIGWAVAFGMVFRLGLTSRQSPAGVVLAGVGLVFMIAFVIMGTACADGRLTGRKKPPGKTGKR